DFRVAEFAFRVKNWVRPLGVHALNIGCQLMGTGMAFPWAVIASAKLASGSPVEDLKLGLDLARSGHPPSFCPAARVDSHYPLSAEGSKTQRRRWEHGHIHMILTTAVSLLWGSLLNRNLRLLVLTIDMAIPPVALLSLLVIAVILLSAVGVCLGLSRTALLISAGDLTACLIAILFSWWKFGRDILPGHAVFMVLPYVLNKLPLYRNIFTSAHSLPWIRTDRGTARDHDSSH